MNRKAFTLIELLVVISIIALLAAFALPAFGKAQERARSVACASNLQNLGIGFRAYLNDNDDTLPGIAAPPDGKPWPQIIQSSYITDWKVFKSPFDPRSTPVSGTTYAVSYGLNSNAISSTYRDYAKWEQPSNTIIAAAVLTGKPSVAASWAGLSSADVKIDPPGGAGTPRGTHGSQKQINVLFGDFHVQTNMQWTTFSRTTGATDADKYRWTPFTVTP